MSQATNEERLAALDPELVALYADETKQEERVIRIFLAEDTEPPTRDRTSKIGFTPREVALLTKYPRPQEADEEYTQVRKAR